MSLQMHGTAQAAIDHHTMMSQRVALGTKARSKHRKMINRYTSNPAYQLRQEFMAERATEAKEAREFVRVSLALKQAATQAPAIQTLELVH